MNLIESICVYCGSSSGRDPRLACAARRFGEILAHHRIRLVYGGGSTGLMGVLSASVRDHGGTVTGIIPEFLKARERAFYEADEVIVTADMHERKRQMFERADAFVALPGGIGTVEELVEQLTWAQLGRHNKPILIANIAGFWDPLLATFDHLHETGLITSEQRLRYLVCDNVEDIVPMLAQAATRVSDAEAKGEPERVGRM